jgi:hypothetical protein
MSELFWWAYLHKNGGIHIKRYVPPYNPITLDDPSYTRQEMLQGNDLIEDVMDRFPAKSIEEAYKLAVKYFSGINPFKPYDRFKDIGE